MSWADAPALIACALFGAGMVHATVTDLAYRRIRNWLVGSLAAGWAPMALAAGIPAAEMATAAASAVLVFAAGFGCFIAGWLGGGDVKLAAVAVLWLGAGQAADFVLLSTVLGAVLTGLMVIARLARPASNTVRADTLPDQAHFGRRVRRQVPQAVPYGPALAVAGLLLLPGSPWAAAI